MGRPPIHEIRRGLIKVRIWRKRTRDRLRHTLTVTRLFRNGDLWKESTRFTRDDIPLIRVALDAAHTWIFRHGERVDRRPQSLKSSRENCRRSS